MYRRKGREEKGGVKNGDEWGVTEGLASYVELFIILYANSELNPVRRPFSPSASIPVCSEPVKVRIATTELQGGRRASAERGLPHAGKLPAVWRGRAST